MFLGSSLQGNGEEASKGSDGQAKLTNDSTV